MPNTWHSKNRRNDAKATTPEKRSRPRELQDTPDLEKYMSTTSGPSKILFCGICTDIFKRPMRAPCGHSFCQKCISTWLSMSKTCPQDRRSLAPQQLHHDFILESLVAELPSKCPYQDIGCEIGVRPLVEIREHAVKCIFNPDNLPDFTKEVMEPPAKSVPASPIVISDEENSFPETPVRTNRSVIVVSPPQGDRVSPPISQSHGEHPSRMDNSVIVVSPPSASQRPEGGQIPLRLRLLRRGRANADQIRDVLG